MVVGQASWALLGWGLFTCLLAANAVRPAYSPWLRGFSFLPQIFIAEAAPWVLPWVAAGTAWLAVAGGLAAWPGWVGLALGVLAVALLGFQIRLALRTAQRLGAALTTGGVAALEATPGRWRRALLPRWLNMAGVERIANLRYAEGRGRRRLLDIYRPKQGTKLAPVLLQIHGGAWVVGSKNTQGRPLVSRLAAEGWVCVAINYRLTPRVRHPEHLIDCKLALKWIREHIAEYGGDPARVAVTGGSAGGHLAALVALTANQPEYQPGFESTDTSVVACIPVYGAIDLKTVFKFTQPRLAKWFSRQVFGDLLEQASPINHVARANMPMMVIQGTADTLVNRSVAENFVAAARAAGKSVQLLEVEGAGHAFDVMHSIRTEAVVSMVVRWLTAVVGSARRGAVNEARLQHADQLSGSERHQEGALAAVDVQRR